MSTAQNNFPLRTLGGLLMGLALGGCATQPAVSARKPVSTELSPAAEAIPMREAWRRAEAYAAAHPDMEVVVGSGDSMLPLYRDHTILVVQHQTMAALRGGMTVVFVGDNGRPVAHALVERTSRGWRAAGLGNAGSDHTLVCYDNYIGTVVKAYAPVLPAKKIALPSAAEVAVVAVTESREGTQ